MKYRASFRPQKTRHDGNVYCVPPIGETDWDATEWVAGLCPNERDEAFKPDTFSSDRLSADPNAPEWIREWSGPFYISLEEVTDAEMDEFHTFTLGVASDGQECPLCHSGTVEVVRVGDPAFGCAPGDFDSETRCRGECGAVAPTVRSDCPGCINCGPPIVVKADEGCGATDANVKSVLGRTEAGDECPLCHNGTVEIVSEVAGERVEQIVINRETRCRGECGAVAYTHPSISPGPGYTLSPSEVAKLNPFTVADMLTIRNLVRAFEEHLSQESHRLGVSVETLCPCSGDEVKAARELLVRLDPLLTV